MWAHLTFTFDLESLSWWQHVCLVLFKV